MRVQCISASTPGEIAFARLMVALSISFLICWMPQLVLLALILLPIFSRMSFCRSFLPFPVKHSTGTIRSEQSEEHCFLQVGRHSHGHTFHARSVHLRFASSSFSMPEINLRDSSPTLLLFGRFGELQIRRGSFGQVHHIFPLIVPN